MRFVFTSIHPRYKRQISERLALGVFAVGYDLEATTGRHQGPFPTSITQQGDEVVVVYDDGEAELDLVRTTDGFEVNTILLLCCYCDGSCALFYLRLLLLSCLVLLLVCFSSFITISQSLLHCFSYVALPMTLPYVQTRVAPG